MRPVFRLIALFSLGVLFALSSCRQHKQCSGLNSEIGKYNTHHRLRKAGRRLKSRPERSSLKYRKRQLKRRKKASNRHPHHHIIHITIGK